MTFLSLFPSVDRSFIRHISGWEEKERTKKDNNYGLRKGTSAQWIEKGKQEGNFF